MPTAVFLAMALFTSDATPARVELTEGKPADLGGGVTATLKSAMYAHLSDSRNSALMTLELRRGAETQTVTLERLWPGPPKFTTAMGLQLAIDFVDAYHQPTTGAVLVLPAASR